MRTLSDIGKDSDKNSWFLKVVVSMACEYILTDIPNTSEISFLWSIRELSLINSKRKKDLESDYYYREMTRLLKTNVFSTQIINNELAVKVVFLFLFSVYIFEEDEIHSSSPHFSFEKCTPSHVINGLCDKLEHGRLHYIRYFQYDIDSDVGAPINYMYFKRSISINAQHNRPYRQLIGDSYRVCKTSLKDIGLLSETAIKKLEIELTESNNARARYSHRNHHKWKNQRDLNDEISFRTKIMKDERKNLIERQKESRLRKGFPYGETFDEYIRFLKTNCKEMEICGHTLRIDDILNIFIPYPLKK